MGIKNPNNSICYIFDIRKDMLYFMKGNGD